VLGGDHERGDKYGDIHIVRRLHGTATGTGHGGLEPAGNTVMVEFMAAGECGDSFFTLIEII